MNDILKEGYVPKQDKTSFVSETKTNTNDNDINEVHEREIANSDKKIKRGKTAKVQ